MSILKRNFKQLIHQVLRYYFVPVPYSSNLFVKIKDRYFSSPSEHLVRLVSLSRQMSSSESNNVVIDVGAADGMTSVFFSSKIKNSIVYSFEPNERVWPQLESNTRNKKNIFVKRIGLFKKKEPSHFMLCTIIFLHHFMRLMSKK